MAAGAVSGCIFWCLKRPKYAVAIARKPHGVRRRDIEQRRRATHAMALQALGYAGFGSAELDDWRQFGTGLVGLQAVERGNSLLAFRMDDRKQRIVIDRAMGDGARFFGWEVADARGARCARRPAGKRRRRRHRRAADARRCAARPRPDLVSRSGRQPARGLSRRRDRRDAVLARAARSRAFAPARSASAMSC